MSVWTGRFADGIACGERSLGGPRRVLIVRVGAMGDVLHALPAVAGLRMALPGVRIGWTVDDRWLPLLADGGVVDDVFAVPTRVWKRQPVSTATARSLSRLYRGLQEEQFDLAIDLQGTLRSGIIAGMSGAARRVGLAHTREGMARLFYDDVVEVGSRHVIGQAAEVVSAAVGERVEPAEVTLPQDAGAARWAAELLETFPAGAPVVLLAPTAGWGAKQWPAERYGELGRTLADQGAVVLANAGRESDPVVAAVVRASGGAVRPVISGVAELVALMRHVTLLVGGDTGPLHLAAVLRRPVVALFGPTDPGRNGPLALEDNERTAGRFRVLRDPASVTDHTRRVETEAGLRRIGVERVCWESLQLLERWTGRLDGGDRG